MLKMVFFFNDFDFQEAWSSKIISDPDPTYHVISDPIRKFKSLWSGRIRIWIRNTASINDGFGSWSNLSGHYGSGSETCQVISDPATATHS